MRKFVLLMSAVLFCAFSAIGQTQRVTGTVTSQDGQPLPGVAVVTTINGTQTGVATIGDGSYGINASPNGTLTFSILGYETQEIEIGGRSVINIVLHEDVTAIDDVIVVGYGTSTRATFTGSATVLDGAKLAERQVSNITNALAGQAAGVQTITSSGAPGQEASIRIRGIGSISSSNSPLYVIDGVPFEGNLSSINPNDIESLSVLKDAAASAIYGARGANGVILITTKRGKTSDARVTVDAKWGGSTRGVPNYTVMDSPAMYYETFYQAMYNSQVAPYSDFSSAAHNYALNNMLNTSNGGLGYQVYTVPNGETLIGTNGKLNPNATLGYTDGEYYYIPDDWYDELFGNTNFRQEYNVSVSGASDKMTYYLSAGYLDDNGIIPNSAFERYTTRINADYQAKKWLKVGANVGFTYYDSQNPSGQTSWGSSNNIFYVANNVAPIYPLYVRDADGNIMVDEKGITVYDFGTTSSTNFSRAFMNNSNPASYLYLNQYHMLTDVVNSRFFATADIIEGLQATANIGVNTTNERYNVLVNPYYGASASAGGAASVSHRRMVSTNQNYMLTYKKNWDKHHFDALAAYESYEYKYQYLYGERYNLYSGNVGEIGNGIMENYADSYTNKYSLLGVLTRLQYDYDGKYFVSASYRRDASSRFNKDNRWGDFGSVGASWLINRENFFNAYWVDMLKVKASWGVQGNDDLLYSDGTRNYYPYADQYLIENSNDDFATTLYYKGNEDITWESNYNFNVGVEFSMFGSRLNGTVEYFNRKTVDLLYYVGVPNVLGYSTVPKNIGEIRNAGIEVELDGDIIRTRNITWNFNLNATHFKNKILDLDPMYREEGIISSVRIRRIGGSLYNAYLREYAGVDKDTGQALYYVYDENDGSRTTTTELADATYRDQGSTLPKLYGGFGSSLRLWDVDFSFQFSYQLGGKVYDIGYQDLMHGGYSSNAGTNWHKDILKSWTEDNTDTNVPRLNSSVNSYQQHSTRWLTSSSYLALNNITLGYTLPHKLTTKLGIHSVRVYAQADNVFIWSVRRGLDPRFTLGGLEIQGSSSGAGTHGYSMIRSISGGLSFSF